MIGRWRAGYPAGPAGEFYSPELTLCADSYLVFVPFRVTAVACKISRSFCQKCTSQVTPKYAHTFAPKKSEWADYAAVQALYGNLSGNELTRDLSGNTWSQSSQLAEPLWTDPGLKSGISLLELISTLRKKKKKNKKRGRK